MKHPNLIIDVGMHDGQDTAFYLGKGFDVVAIEANPGLAEAARHRFASEIESGQLQILPVAVAETAGMLPLVICDDLTIWSTTSTAFAARIESAGMAHHCVDVPSRTFESILEEVGVPRYLKVDIEGMDMLCIRALKRLDTLPDFVSTESNVTSPTGTFDEVFDELSTLWQLGYRRFAYVNQRKHASCKPPHPPREGRFAEVVFNEHSSGMFGEELPVRWLTIEQAMHKAQMLRLHYDMAGLSGRWPHVVSLPGLAYSKARAVVGHPIGWYDLHARLN